MPMPAGALSFTQARTELGMTGPLYMSDPESRLLATEIFGNPYTMVAWRNKRCSYFDVTIADNGPNVRRGFSTSPPVFGSGSGGSIGPAPANDCTRYMFNNTGGGALINSIELLTPGLGGPYWLCNLIRSAAGVPTRGQPIYNEFSSNYSYIAADVAGRSLWTSMYTTTSAVPTAWFNMVGQTTRVQFFFV